MSYQMPQRKIVHAAWMIPVLIVLIVFGVIGFFVYRGVVGDVITLTDHPLVSVTSCSTVRVYGQPGINTVTIKVDSGDSTDYERDIDSNAVYIAGHGCSVMTLWVPTQTTLKIEALSALEVTNVNGEMNLRGGDISLMNTTLQGKSVLNSSDPIYFRGSIARGCTLSFASVSSFVDIEIPKDSFFDIDVKSRPQSFTTNFSQIQIPPDDTAFPGIDSFKSRVGIEPAFSIIVDGSLNALVLTGV